MTNPVNGEFRLEGRREKRQRWVCRGHYAVRVEVEVVFLDEEPTTALFEPHTLRFMDEVAARAAAGDLDYLRKVGRVYQSVA